ncbi:hypothetical protein BD779DRAFT_1672676 [Infundibulicybe gibba]|nr:hypothetical protein BD779DRAFT_1672676 [Infundibulicybe gibba]
MFSKVFVSTALLLTLSLQVHGHAAIAPVLGVAGAPARSDVQRPSAAAACGKTNVAATIDTSTPVVAAADGTFSATVTNFNGGADGSRKVTASVDATGAGKTFSAITVSQNGDAAPADVGSQPLTAALPAGTKCTGGKAGNLCLVSFKTTAGFGNCVVVQQGAAGAAAANSTAGAAAAGGAAGAAAAGGAAGAAAAGGAAGAAAAGGAAAAPAASGAAAATTAKKGANKAAGAKAAGAKAAAHKAAAGQQANKAAGQKKAKAAAGTRAPRALIDAIEARGEETFGAVKRGFASWIWA